MSAVQLAPYVPEDFVTKLLSGIRLWQALSDSIRIINRTSCPGRINESLSIVALATFRRKIRFFATPGPESATRQTTKMPGGLRAGHRSS
jgi:hypothetical protein